MIKRIYIIFSLVSLTAFIHANTISIDTIQIESEILHETRSIIIFYPEEMKSDLPIDMLYMLDGEWAESRFALWDEVQAANPLIGIGIINTKRNRDLLPNMEAGRFMDFIELELIPLLEEKILVRERILYGHSFAGGFTINTMIRKPGLFDKYIASSPIPIMSFIDPQIYKDLDKHLDNEVKFYFSYGARDMKQVRKWAGKLHMSLSILVLEQVKWKNDIHDRCNHSSSAIKAFSKGLSF